MNLGSSPYHFVISKKDAVSVFLYFRGKGGGQKAWEPPALLLFFFIFCFVFAVRDFHLFFGRIWTFYTARFGGSVRLARERSGLFVNCFPTKFGCEPKDSKSYRPKATVQTPTFLMAEKSDKNLDNPYSYRGPFAQSPIAPSLQWIESYVGRPGPFFMFFFDFFLNFFVFFWIFFYFYVFFLI